MTPPSHATNPSALVRVPAAVRRVAETLAAADHEVFLVGGCLRDQLLGRAVDDFDLATSAEPTEVLALLPHAIPIGLRHGTVMVPTPDGPVDVTRFRGSGGIEADLAHRDFTINAMACALDSGALLDPFGGLEDLREGRLRAVGSAAERLREDPLRGLRAARLLAAMGLEIDDELEAALPAVREQLPAVARERIRRELEGLFVGPRVERGLALLERTGIARDLFGETRPDAAAIVASLPRELEPRLAAWLLGTKPEKVLARLRFSRHKAQRVAHLLRHHPLGAGVNPKRDPAIRRLIRQVGEDDLPLLAALRRAEIAVADGPAADEELARLAAIEAAIERVRQQGSLALRRFDLAVDGAAVMEILGCGPGRTVGRALRYLTEAVIDDPLRNDPAALRRLLEAWAERETEP